jgi:hypothetical protein
MATVPTVPDSQENLTTVSAINEFIAKVRDTVHLLLPFTTVDSLAPMSAVSKRWISIDPDVNHGEVYKPRPDQPFLALTRIGLEKLSHAAGIDVVDTRHTDPAPRVCCFRYVGRIREFDGSYRIEGAERLLDLRDESDQIVKLTLKDLSQRRLSIHSLCETMARERMVRTMLALRGAYHPKELEKPFVALKLVPNPDMNDPLIRQFITEQMLGTQTALYGYGQPGSAPSIQPERRALEGKNPVITVAEAIEPVHIDATAASAIAEALTSAPPEPPPTVAESKPLKQPNWQTTEEPPRPMSNLDRAKLMAEIVQLYYRKYGKSRKEVSPEKAPLEELADVQLQHIKAALEAKPDNTESLV